MTEKINSNILLFHFTLICSGSNSGLPCVLYYLPHFSYLVVLYSSGSSLSTYINRTSILNSEKISRTIACKPQIPGLKKNAYHNLLSQAWILASLLSPPTINTKLRF